MHPKTKQIDARVQALHFCEDGSDTPAAVSSVLAKPPYNGSDTRPVIHLALGIGCLVVHRDKSPSTECVASTVWGMLYLESYLWRIRL
jgi:hypothetical protein